MLASCGGIHIEKQVGRNVRPITSVFVDECSDAETVATITAKRVDSVTMENSCSIQIYGVETAYLFRIVGRGTRRESPAVRDFVRGALEDGANVVIDLSPCEHLDSTFLGCLVIFAAAQ